MTPDDRDRLANMRVLWVSHSFGYGGDLMYYGEIFRQFRILAPKMAVVVDAATPYESTYGLELLPWMRLLRMPITRRAPGGDAYDTEIVLPGPMLLPRLARSRADVLIAIEFTLPALVAAFVASRSRRTRLLLLVESDPAGRGGSSNPVVRWLKRWAVRQAQVIQTNNDAGRRYLVDTLAADPGRVIVAPYLTSRPPGPEASRIQGKGPLRILFANSLVPRKGFMELLASLALIEPRMLQHLALTVVGDGPLRQAAEARAAQLQMAEPVQFVGRQRYAELGRFYATADVLAIPTLADYRSLAGFEGLAYGLALLASRHDGATAETVIEGVNGLVTDPEDQVLMAEQLTRLAGDRDLVASMQRESRSRYERIYSVERVAENIARSALVAASGR